MVASGVYVSLCVAVPEPVGAEGHDARLPRRPAPRQAARLYLPTGREYRREFYTSV